MKRSGYALFVVILGLVMTACTQSKDDKDYPKKPIRFIVPYGAGGGGDTTARQIAKLLGEKGLVKVELPVENIEGGSGQVFLLKYAQENVGDPNSIFISSTPMVLNYAQGFQHSLLEQTPLAMLISEYFGFAVAVDSPYKNLEQMLQALKKNPSSLKIGGGSKAAGFDHLVFLLIAKRVGVDIAKVQYVPYEGGGYALTALQDKLVDVVSSSTTEYVNLLEAGKIRILAVTSPRRLSDVFKDIPTLKESGYDLDVGNWRGILGAKNMPPYAKKYWEEVLAQMVILPEWKELCKKNNWAESYMNSEYFTQYLQKQTDDFSALSKELGLSKK